MRTSSLMLSAIAVGMVPASVWAQTSGEASPRPQSEIAGHDATALEEIIVTAQRRSQSLQDVPISVTAFNAEALALKNVTSVADLQQVDSSLVVSQQAGVIHTFLRGIGNPTAGNPGNEASAPLYIDDVYFARVTTAQTELGNIERVEVLKGPQGTLFGRNATGGLIHIITRDPGETMTGNAELGYANYQTYSGKLYFSTPIAEGVAADLSLSGMNQTKGWGKNPTNGRDTYRRKYYNIRSKLVIEPTETTRLRLSGFYTYQRTGQGIATRVYTGTIRGYPIGSPLQGMQYTEAPNFFDLRSNTEIFHRFRGYGGSARIDQEFGFADFTSITSYRRAKELLQYEGDHTDINWQQFNLNPRDRQFTQEFQLKSKPSSPVSWIVGAFYFYNKAGFDPTVITGDQVTASGVIASTNIVGLQTVKSYAGFGQATFPVIDGKTNITTGVRYTRDEVSGDGRIYTISPTGVETTASAFQDKKNFGEWTYRIGIDHDFTEGVMAYASWSRGFKSGVFNTNPLNAPPTNPEIVTAYEAGLKVALFDRRVRGNIAVFRNDLKNPQVNLIRIVDTPSGPTPLVFYANAEKARTKGFEFDVTALAAPGLTLDFAGQYLWAKFIDFQNAPFAIARSGPPWGNMQAIGDASGNRMPRTPRWKLNAGFSYDIPTSIGELSLNGQMAYRSNLTWDPDNIKKEPALTLFNASVAFKPQFNPNLSVRLWGANLTDERYFSGEVAQANPAANLGAPGDPRTYGVEVRYQF